MTRTSVMGPKKHNGTPLATSPLTMFTTLRPTPITTLIVSQRLGLQSTEEFRRFVDIIRLNNLTFTRFSECEQY